MVNTETGRQFCGLPQAGPGFGPRRCDAGIDGHIRGDGSELPGNRRALRRVSAIRREQLAGNRGHRDDGKDADQAFDISGDCRLRMRRSTATRNGDRRCRGEARGKLPDPRQGSFGEREAIEAPAKPQILAVQVLILSAQCGVDFGELLRVIENGSKRCALFLQDPPYLTKCAESFPLERRVHHPKQARE